MRLDWGSAAATSSSGAASGLRCGTPIALETPHTGRPSTSANLCLPASSRSLSGLVVRANQRQEVNIATLRRLDQLQDRLAPIRPGTSDGAAIGGPPAAGLAARGVVDEIGSLFDQASAMYQRPKRVDQAAVEEDARRQAQEQRRQAQAREERRREALQKKLALHAASKSLVHQAVVEKMQSLREDEAELAAFQARLAAQRGGGAEQSKVEENIRRFSDLTPAAFARDVQLRQAERREAAEARATAAKQACGELRERKEREMLSAVHARRDAHELAVARQRARPWQARALAWFALIALAHRTDEWGAAVRRGRAERLAKERRAAAERRIKRTWRRYVLVVKVNALNRGMRALRKQVWWWRFRKSIERKRRAVAAILDLLVVSRHGNVQQQMRRLKYRVWQLQRAWRRAWRVMQAQHEVLSVHWAAYEFRHASALAAHGELALGGRLEKAAKQLVLREDLRERKLAYTALLAAWRQRYLAWEKRRDSEEMLISAKEMMARDDGVAAQAAEEAAPPEERKVIQEKRRRRTIAVLESKGVEHPGSRPLFVLLPTDDRMAKLVAKARAKVRAMQAQQAAANLYGSNEPPPLLMTRRESGTGRESPMLHHRESQARVSPPRSPPLLAGSRNSRM